MPCAKDQTASRQHSWPDHGLQCLQSKDACAEASVNVLNGVTTCTAPHQHTLLDIDTYIINKTLSSNAVELDAHAKVLANYVTKLYLL